MADSSSDDDNNYRASLLNSLEQDGFVVIRGAFDPDSVETLRRVCDHVTTLARAGQWPYVRTLPKQFPPWTSDISQGIWGVQHLLHPDLPGHTTFAASYFSDRILKPVKAILGVPAGDDDVEDLIMELYNLLVRPDRDFALRWHRDDIPPTATEEEELDRLHRPAWHAQWNLALHPDDSLVVVPGSHGRARTPAERAADPFDPALPGQRAVHLEPGDAVFYNNNILHRGVYRADRPRLTLHGSVGHRRGAADRARNVLQHGVGAWVARCDFNALDGDADGDRLWRRAERMRRNLIEMGGGLEATAVAEGKVGFAHAD